MFHLGIFSTTYYLVLSLANEEYVQIQLQMRPALLSSTSQPTIHHLFTTILPLSSTLDIQVYRNVHPDDAIQL